MSRAITVILAVAILAWAGPAAAKSPEPRALSSCASFSSHGEIGALLAQWADDHPAIARVSSLGTSVLGREIWAIEISDEPEIADAEPGLRIIGAIHGNECISAEIVLEIGGWLLDGYGSDALATSLIDGAHLLLVPLVNPDGYSSPGASRENANGVDLNRNLGFGWIDEGPRPFSEPETRALRDASQARNFTLGLSYHTVAEYVNGPWNYTPHHPLDEDLIKAIGESYAGSSSYDAVFGWDWYNINGDVNDWSLGTRGTFDWTIELTSDTVLHAEIHGPGAAAFMAWVFTGVRGVVTDAETGDPLLARITVEPAGEPVFTDPSLGAYHRVLLPGFYDVTAWASGRLPATATGVEVVSGALTDMDFELERGGEYAAVQVDLMTIPQEIATWAYQWIDYQNQSRVHDVLGPPDDLFYSMSPGGSVTVDLGPATPATDGAGGDIIVMSGTGSGDPAAVLVAQDQDGPFAPAAGGSGDIEVDLAVTGLEWARYVRVVDTGSGQFNAPTPGYDLDAVVNLSPPPEPDGGPDADTDGDSDTDGDGDADTDGDGGSNTFQPGSAGCGCDAAGSGPWRGVAALLLEALPGR
jgi:carboxypeptidase D